MAKDVKYIFNTYYNLLPSLVDNLNDMCSANYSTLDYVNKLQIYFITQKLKKSDVETMDEIGFYARLDKELKKKVVPIKFKILNPNVKSFNKDNYEEHEYSYQRMRDENVKKYLFPKDINSGINIDVIKEKQKEYIKNCIAVNSVDYDAAKTAYLTNNKTNSKYKSFTNDYNIYEKPGDGEIYKSNDYFRLNIKEDKIIENEIVLTCDDLYYFENKKDQDSVLNTGMYGFVLSYKDALNDDYKENFHGDCPDGMFEIPIMLYLYAKPTYSNYNKIKLVFNVNGLFGVV